MNPNTSSKNDWITTASVALFILLAIGIVGFFYYQNQELKKIIANYQNSTPVPAPVSTFIPKEMVQSASPSAAPKPLKTIQFTIPVSTSSASPVKY